MGTRTLLALALATFVATVAGQVPCPSERCDSTCQSLCIKEQDGSKCERWCYNLGAAPLCKEHCYNLGTAANCKSNCYNAVGGFSEDPGCPKVCVDPSTKNMSVDYYPAQLDPAAGQATIEVDENRVFSARGKNFEFALEGVSASIVGMVSATNAIDTRLRSTEVGLGNVQQQANEADAAIELLQTGAADLETRLDTLAGDGSTEGLSVFSNKADIDSLRQELEELTGSGSAGGSSATVKGNAVLIAANTQRISDLENVTDSLIEDLASHTDHPELSGTLAAEIVAVKKRVTTNENVIDTLSNTIDNDIYKKSEVYTKTEADSMFVPQAGTDACTQAKQDLLRLFNGAIQQCKDGAWKDITGGSTGSGGGTPVILRPNGCSDLLAKKPETTDGVHEVAIKSEPAEHYCLMSSGGLSLGGDGSDAPNAGLSCATIFHRFSKTASGKYFVNANLNANDGGKAAQVYCNMNLLASSTPGGDGSTQAQAATSCATLQTFHPLTASVSKAYWIQGSTTTPVKTFCDMDTQGGGWTLVAKVRGEDATLNAKNVAQWRDGTPLGSVEDLGDANALGKSYSTVSFTDVMVRSLGDPKKSLGWRHPQPYSSVKSVVNQCKPVRSGKKIFGSITSLDYPTPGQPERYKECEEIDYGFLLSDYSYTYYSIAGCPTNQVASGHSGAVFAAASNTAGSCSYGIDDGYCRSCITNWGVGSGYYQMTTTDDQYAINAHWWGNGNEDTYRWNTQAVFVREPLRPSLGGDGTTAEGAGASCQTIKDKFGAAGVSERFIITENGAVTKGFCDFGSITADPAVWLGGNGGSFDTAGLRCDTIKQYYNSIVSGAYYILDPKHGATPVYCDMTTEGGGWTMLAKVVGEDPTLNARNSRQWRNGQPAGTPGDLSNVNTLTRAYSTVSFDHVMIRSLSNNNFRLGWSHPETYKSALTIVQGCKKIDDGVRMFGAVDTLDYDGNGDRWSACSELRYGWFTNDWTYTVSQVANCPLQFGHASGIAGAGVPPVPKDYGTDDGTYRNCISNFNLGSGYYDMSTPDDQYAINAHFWGAGNDATHTWNSHALFVRMSGPYLNQQDGSSQTKPGRSCESLKAKGQTESKMYWILPPGAENADDSIEVKCDMSGSGVSLGNDGSSERRPGISCKSIKDTFDKKTDGSYYIMGLKGTGVLTFCDQTTQGGGWTLVAKVRGNDPYMNARNTRQWRAGVPLGDGGSLKAENALTEQYSTVSFTDVMIRSPTTPDRSIGWRHPQRHSSVRDIVLACQAISDGTKLWGSFQNLDHPTGNQPARYTECTQIRYGFMLADWTYKESRVAGCYRLPYGHAAGVFGGAVPIGNYQYGTHDGSYRSCLSSFGIGGGYYQLGPADDQYAINAHWWGNGNEDVFSWGDQAVFVR